MADRELSHNAMNILAELKNRFHDVLAEIAGDSDVQSLLDMIKPAQDARFGDYQANFAMPLGKRLGQAPRDIAAQIIEQVSVDDICSQTEIAGPGFINLTLCSHWLTEQVNAAAGDPRVGVAKIGDPKTFVLDYSSPNVAKPMHVGHIRSTVIGDSLARSLRFLGHQVITDNHLGDWGTQFGMIIYGYKHFVDQDAYQQHEVNELSRLYRLVNQLIEFWKSKNSLEMQQQEVEHREAEVVRLEQVEPTGDKKEDKKQAKALGRAKDQLSQSRKTIASLQATIAAVESDSQLHEYAQQHPEIARHALLETARLHEGDETNRQLWEQFLPKCREEMQRVYRRLNVEFDHEYGESYYHEMLPGVVADLQQAGLATESEGAQCVFLDEFETPMIIQKSDGAYLYATTDLATIEYRRKQWDVDEILYVVDHRQSEHFQKLFAVARVWNAPDIEMHHISFGTVLDESGRPYKTRSGDAVGLEGLLDEAVSKALEVVSANDDRKPNGPELDEAARHHIADVVGHGAIKYADLSHNRTSDYVFSYDKMMALEGNTATYMQYSYARVQSIFRKGGIDVESLREASQSSQSSQSIVLAHDAERGLAKMILRYSEALENVMEDYRPNQLTNYLFDLAKRFSSFFEQCPVLKAEEDTTRQSRLQLCDLTGRVIAHGLSLLGIGVVDQM